MSFFNTIEKIPYEGYGSKNPLAFKYYNANEMILGKTMAEHLRLAVCYWHTFCWDGRDVFGMGTLNRPWQKKADQLMGAKEKADIAFEFFTKLGVPYYCFHDLDIAPEGHSFDEYFTNFNKMIEVLEAKQEETGVKLLWGTANCTSNPRYLSGAATNPDPEIFACAATQVATVMNATHRLKGENYVLWGGREGYQTLLNTDLRRERTQLGRFMSMVVEHKYKIGFNGTLLIEPKPKEPTKHQYDYDSATVYGFLKEFGLENEIKVNIEANHATLAGHSFQHEVATACSLGIFGSIDTNRGDPLLGWDTDQFPNSVEENTLVMYEILKNGGFTTGGFNFDAKLHRQSIDPVDLFYAHIGAIDTLALSLRKAAKMLSDKVLQDLVQARYAGWDSAFGKEILFGHFSLADLATMAKEGKINPRLQSGRQEYFENIINSYLYK